MSSTETPKKPSADSKQPKRKSALSRKFSTTTISTSRASRSRISVRSRATYSGNVSFQSAPYSLGAFRGSLLFRIDQSGFKIPRYQNTYRLEPYNPYKVEIVDKILSNVMNALLSDVKYEPKNCMQICQDITAEVRDQIFRKNYDRYKFVVLVSLIQKLGQHIHVDFGRLWDAERDTYSSCTVETTEFIAFGLVVAMYYE